VFAVFAVVSCFFLDSHFQDFSSNDMRLFAAGAAFFFRIIGRALCPRAA